MSLHVSRFIKLSSQENSDSDSDTDSDSDFKLRISHKRLKTDALHETTETNSHHEEAPDFNETNENNSIERSIISSVTAIPSTTSKYKQKSKQKSKQKAKRKKINRTASKDKQKAVNHEDDEFLRHAAFQNGLDELLKE
jgi:hypothetical protein